MDFFLDDKNIVNRLVNEWLKYGELIIAYDFDDTVSPYKTKSSEQHTMVIELLKRCKNLGAKFIVFTCRNCNDKEHYDIVTKYLNENKIPYDAINVDLDVSFGSRKIYYNVLLDDRAGLASAYNCLLKAVEIMEKK